MKKIDCKTKILITMAVCSLILCSIAGYFVLETSKVSNKLNETQHNLEITFDELNTTKNELRIKDSKILELNEYIDELNEDLRSANIMLAELKSDEYKLSYMGNFRITYYCDERRNHICGGNGITKSGEPTEVGWTAAADWGVLPNGSIVYISGVGYRKIADVGGAVDGNHIDVLVKEHQEALNLGASYKDVWVLVKK